MCGINGFTFQNEILVKRMNKLLLHRGPDTQGFATNKDVSLGSTRLSILDLRDRAKMPMNDFTGRFTLVYNGEIYNHQQLRKQLIKKGTKFNTTSDSEVLVNAFREYGLKVLPRLNGMFAFGIWDHKHKSLTLARDKIGIKPLYYSLTKNGLIFSSEIKPILLHLKNRQLNSTAVDNYFKFLFSPGRDTVVQGISKLLPGEYLVWNKRGHTLNKYYKFNDFNQLSDIHKAKKTLFSLLKKSVESQLIADRKVGLFLSGGVDSSIVAYFASKLLGKKLNTFSIGFSKIPELEKYNADFLVAKQTSKFYKTTHHEIYISPQQAKEDFLFISKNCDYPLPNPTSVSSFRLSKEASNSITVALGGDGGDELFRGYSRYKLALMLDLYQRIPELLRKNVFDILILKFKNRGNVEHLLSAKTHAQKYRWLHGSPEKEIQDISLNLSSTNWEYLENSISESLTNSKAFHIDFNKLDLINWLSAESLERTDKTSMLASIEQRVPFLDERLIEFSLKVPFWWNMNFKSGKLLLKQTMEKYLPPGLSDQPKRGFYSPASKWIRDKHWQEVLNDSLSKDTVETVGIHNYKKINLIKNAHLKGSGYHMSTLWAVMNFNLWHRHIFKSPSF